MTEPRSNAHISNSQLSDYELIQFNQLVSTLYQCLESSAGFQSFFDAFKEHFHTLNGGILAVTENPQRISFCWTFGYPEGFEEWFMNSDLPEGDEAITRFRQLPVRQFDSFMQGDTERHILDLIPEDSPSRPWVEQQGIGDSAGMLVTKRDQLNIIFMTNRHQKYGAFNNSELLQMNLLAPHIENAVSLRLKLYESDRNNDSLAVALSHVSKPLVVINSMAKVATANDAAMSLIGKSKLLNIDDSKSLCSPVRRINRNLTDGIAMGIVQSLKQTATTNMIFADDGYEKIAMSLTPLISEESAGNGVLIELFDYQLDIEVDTEKLQSLFDCTQAEANIAIELMHGLSAQDIVEKNGVSIHTVRQQIKSLLAKNGYHKQTELIAMLMRALG